MSSLAVLILAAGKGERMRSALPKALHSLGGRPLLWHSLQTAKALQPQKLAVVVGHSAEQVQRQFPDKKIRWALQRRQLGTADAVLAGLEALKDFRGLLSILYADVPLVTPQTLHAMRKALLRDKASLVVLTAELDNPTGYGRIIRNSSGFIQRVVEEKEAQDWEKEIREVNTGIYLVDTELLRGPLRRVKKSIVKGEYYLTSLVEEFVQEGRSVSSLSVHDLDEVRGVNSREELAGAEGSLQRRIQRRWMAEGVSFLQPASNWIGIDVELAQDVILHPGVIVNGASRIGTGAEIFPYSVIEESVVREKARIGPFAHLRPGSVVGPEAHVGNFVEIKKTKLGRGAKANHLSYLGDAFVGDGANIGAGTITCNYDGHEKHRTVIGEGAFIGSDTQLVAPVRVGKKAFVGAGTTVTKDIPAEALAVSRVEQKNIRGWAKKR